MLIFGNAISREDNVLPVDRGTVGRYDTEGIIGCRERDGAISVQH